MLNTAENKRLYITRSYDFSASHFLKSIHLSSQENIDIYGKCGREAGHGHNYRLKVTLKGTPEPKTGELISRDKMDCIIKKNVLEKLDHQNINSLFKKEEVATAENISKKIWEWLFDVFEKPELHKIELWETSKNGFEYFG